MSTFLLVGIGFAASAQTKTPVKEKAATEKVTMKEHVCTDACKKAGKCVMAHGEKGHVCTKDCKKAM